MANQFPILRDSIFASPLLAAVTLDFLDTYGDGLLPHEPWFS